MWTLLLSRVEDPRTHIERRQFDGGAIKIGRAVDKCDWVIPDVEGYVSREHCTLLVSGLDLFVIDTSSGGTSINDEDARIVRDQPTMLHLHDRIILGGFMIEVAPVGAIAGAAPPPAPPQSPMGGMEPDQWFQSNSDPIWNAGEQSREVHDFLGNALDDFLGTPGQPAGMDRPPPGPVGMGQALSMPIMAPMDPAQHDFGIPEDWHGAMAAPNPPPVAPPHPPLPVDVPLSLDPLADPMAGTPSVDIFGPAGADVPPPLTQDPFADLPPPPLMPEPPLEPSAAPQAAGPPAASGQGDATWAAFCEGAGIDAEALRRSPDAMRRLGVLYRQVVLGLSDLIRDRAAFKNEFRLGVTTLALGRNNPLKMLDPIDAARILLDNPMPGFLDSEEAVRSAFEDIKRHQMAMLAGLQHALTAMFKRLAPTEIEQLIKKAAGEKRGLAFRRGVDPWTVYQTVFDALRLDATSNANSIMSIAFREGYEAFLSNEPKQA